MAGHSLGGAVAALCTLRLLAALPRPPPPAHLRCLSFGCPAFGNAALAAHVHEQGWDAYFYSYALPGKCTFYESSNMCWVGDGTLSCCLLHSAWRAIQSRATTVLVQNKVVVDTKLCPDLSV